MNKKWSRQSLKNVQTAVWLIGLGVLFLLDAFWPGILILIGLSMLVQSFMPEEEEPPAPQFDQGTKPEGSVKPEDTPPVEEPPSADTGAPDMIPPPLDPLQVFASGLPKECPVCGGPVAENAEAVKSAGEGVVLCPFCDARLKLV